MNTSGWLGTLRAVAMDAMAAAAPPNPEHHQAPFRPFGISPSRALRTTHVIMRWQRPFEAARWLCLWGSSLMLVVAPQAAMAGTANVEADAKTIFQHNLGYYPLSPALEGGWRSLGSGGLSYEGSGVDGTFAQILAGGSASSGQVRGFTQIAGEAHKEYWNTQIHVELDASWRDTISAPSSRSAAPDGTPVPVRITRLAQQFGDPNANASVNILGWTVNMAAQPNGFYYSEEVVDNFLTVGAAVNIGLRLQTKSSIFCCEIRGQYKAKQSNVIAAYAIEILDPRFVLNDDEGRPAPVPRLTQGLNDQRPLTPYTEERTEDGRSRYTFPHEVIGSDGVAPRYYIDPPVASGYEYSVLSGPLFTTVLLPDVGDGLYGIEVWNGTGWDDLGVQVRAGESFDLRSRTGTNGISRFRVTGIEESAGIDPHGHQFVTGLTFNASGEVLFTQESLVTSVPEPATHALLLTGFLALMLRHRALRRQTSEAGGAFRTWGHCFQ